MSLRRLHRVVTYLMVVVGLVPLSLSGELSLLPILLTYGAIAVSWFYEVPRAQIEAHAGVWTGVSLVAFLLSGAMGYATGNMLLYATYFTLVMVVLRLFQSRGSRDLFQLYGLTFLAVIAGAVVNPTLSFVFLFLAYVVLLTWGLIMLHLLRTMERMADDAEAFGEPPPDLGGRARRLVSPGFLLGTSALALGLFASSLAIFFFFPRLGMGFFFSQGRAGQPISGFSDRIELGHFGTIKDNLRVVMRVEFPDDPERADRRLRMRGISFDHYDGRVWSKTLSHSRELPRESGGTWRVPDLSPGLAAHAPVELVQEVYLEPLEMDQRMIFGEPSISQLGIDNATLDRLRKEPVRFYGDDAGDVSTRGRTTSALKYRVTSLVTTTPMTPRAEGVGETPEMVASVFLQLPSELDPRVRALAQQLTEGVSTPWEKALRIRDHLEAELAYSTEGGHDRQAPLSDFLFDRKAGHCEYFATAMTILLRTVGVPARPANGFYGGAYNRFGRYYALRQADAHSWVEAWMPGYGWATFDPTPARSVLVPGHEGTWGSVEAWVDSLRLAWFKWVVEYDLEKQIAFFQGIGEAFGGGQSNWFEQDGADAPKRSPRAWREAFNNWLKKPGKWWAMGALVLLFFLWRLGALSWLWRHTVGRDRVRAPGGEVGRVYLRTRQILTRQGLGGGPGETPRELAARVTQLGHPAAAEIARIAGAFEAVRYGRGPSPSGGGLREDLRAVRRRRPRRAA